MRQLERAREQRHQARRQRIHRAVVRGPGLAKAGAVVGPQIGRVVAVGAAPGDVILTGIDMADPERLLEIGRRGVAERIGQALVADRPKTPDAFLTARRRAGELGGERQREKPPADRP